MSATISYTIDEWTKKIPCKTVLTLGRDKASDIVLTDLMVSRNHAMIRRVGHADYYLIDGGSANGSYINRQRVTVPRLLKNGDVISIGRVDFLFEQDPPDSVELDTVCLQETIVHDKPDIKQITILVADIRGFTSLSEGLHIRTLTRMMNTWFNEVSDIIFANNGIVDKFIGDCVFARWETDANQAQTVIRALCAAEDINRATEQLNRDFSEVSEALKIGVGINTGAASVGAGLGNSALGDAVNVAFRLESVTKTLGKDIVMSETAYRHLPRQAWERATQKIRVKGRRDPIRIFALDFTEVQHILAELA